MPTTDYIDARAYEVHGIAEKSEPVWRQKAAVARENLFRRMGRIRDRGMRFIRRHWFITYLAIVVFSVVAVYYFGLLVVGPLLAMVVAVSPLLGIILFVLYLIAIYLFAYWFFGKVLVWLTK